MARFAPFQRADLLDESRMGGRIRSGADVSVSWAAGKGRRRLLGALENICRGLINGRSMGAVWIMSLPGMNATGGEAGLFLQMTHRITTIVLFRNIASLQVTPLFAD